MIYFLSVCIIVALNIILFGIILYSNKIKVLTKKLKERTGASCQAYGRLNEILHGIDCPISNLRPDSYIFDDKGCIIYDQRSHIPITVRSILKNIGG